MAQSKSQYVATMKLPPGGKAAWTRIMQGNPLPSDKIPKGIPDGTPLVQAYAVFKDGTQVTMGLLAPAADDTVKFAWAFDAQGNQVPGYPIDPSDDEDFMGDAIIFRLADDEPEDKYRLNIVEAKPRASRRPLPKKPGAKKPTPAKKPTRR